MPSIQPNPTIVVLGATGTQGSGVVRALLSNKFDGSPWLVRALTQDPSSGKAQKLLSDCQTSDNRLNLVTGQVYDAESLRNAFAGAHGVFAMTSERYPGKVIADESEMGHELDAGRNIIMAAKEREVKHLVFSSLPDIIAASDGQFKRIHHMNNKAAIDQLARKELDGFTSLIPGFFYDNLIWPQYSRLREDGVVQFCLPLPGHQAAQWTDPAHDMGAFAASKSFSTRLRRLLEELETDQSLKEIFGLGVEKTKGQTYLALGSKITPESMARTFTRVTGKPAVHSPISFEEFGQLSSSLVGPAFKEDAIEMMQWAAIAPVEKICYGALDPAEEESNADLGLTASSFEDWLRRSGWTGPKE